MQKGLVTLLVVGIGIAAAVVGAARPAHLQTGAKNGQKPDAAARDGTTSGTLTVGTSKIQLAYAAAVVERDGANDRYRVLLTDKPFPAEALNDEDERIKIFSNKSAYGLEILVTPDRHVVRTNIYHPDLAARGIVLGVMLLEPATFEATALDAQRIAGKLFTAKPIVGDNRIGKSVEYNAVFSTSIARMK